MIIQRAPASSAGAPARSTAAGWLLALACWGYLALVLGLWLTMRCAGDRHWLGTVLILAPRMPAALPLVILWPWALLAGRRPALAANLLATGAVFLLVIGWRIPWSFGPSERGDLRVLTCNVHRQQFDPAKLAAYIAQVRPDVVALQGWSDARRESLFGPGDGDWQVRTDGELLVASRRAILSVTPLDITDGSPVSKGERGAAAIFELETPLGPINLICLHLASPHAGLLTFPDDSGRKLSGNIDRRWFESDRLLALASARPGPLLLAGDFNTTDDSPIFREHWGAFADAFSERGWGFGYTYVIGRTQLRIDHILADPSWRVVGCWVGPDIGTAHRPLVADLNSR